MENKGIDISREYYRLFGAPMIHDKFPELECRLAIGVAGAGSECFGFDDELSRDHDFDPGFCIFVPDGIDRSTLFRLERAYASLPREFMGIKRPPVNPAGGGRRGVILQGDFLGARTGHRDGAISLREWMRLPEHYLAEAVNGEIFRDDEGTFSGRRRFLSEMPSDIRLKKLAGHLVMMSQTGEYNYPRAVSRNDMLTSQITLFEFTRHAMAASFNICGVYMPFYKWASHALRCEDAPFDVSLLEALLGSGNTHEKTELIIEISNRIISALISRGISPAKGSDLQTHAFACNSKIESADIRNLSILYAC